MTNSYEPHPLDTSAVTLSVELLDLQEELAANAHEVWAAQRIQDGWRYGPSRDDETKEHPCLVSYDQLLDSEKEYDRRLVAETLRAILILGYEIQPPPAQ